MMDDEAMVMQIFDTHTHLNDERLFENAKEYIQKAEAAGVFKMLVPGYDMASSHKALELAERHPSVFAAVGVHPHDAKTVSEQDYLELKEWANHPKVVAIGEIGLDYHYDYSPRDVQAEVFRVQMELANVAGLPIIVHDREAHGDVLTLIKEVSPLSVGGILHSFSGSLEMAEECIKLGFFISFSGTLTFKNAKRPREIAATLPLERLLVETDAPYLTPEPYRGKQNEPAYVRYVLEKMIELRTEPADLIAVTLYRNAHRVFLLEE